MSKAAVCVESRNPCSASPILSERHSHLRHPLTDDLERGSPSHDGNHHDVPPPAPRPFGIKGNPGPLGLLCFGMTTCTLMFTTTTWSPAGLLPVVMGYGFFYGGAAQFVAGVLELIRGNTFSGTAFSSYGCFWMGWSLWHYWESVTGQVAKVGTAALTGETLWLCLWGFLTLFFFVATLRKNGCLQTIFASLFITFFLLAGGNYSEGCKKAAGYVGFFCGASAIYMAFAELYQSELGWSMPGLKPTKYI